MSGSIRLFVDEPLSEGAAIAASPGQAHYLGTVMRRAVGDAVAVFNGRDGEWAAEIAALKRDRATLALRRRLRPQAAEPDVWLAFAPLKRDATDWVVQKATELGVAALLPVLTERSNTLRVNEERLRGIAIEAAEQCERLSVPRIAAPRRLFDVLADWPAGRPLVAATERQDAPGPRPHWGPEGVLPVGLLIGPEGGFTPLELDALQRHALVVPASLGPRILRAETAAIVGLALLMVPSGD